MLTPVFFNDFSFSILPKRTYSLPAIRIADPGPSSDDSHVIDTFYLDKEVQQHVTRSFSLPKNVNSRENASVVHVISAAGCSDHVDCGDQDDAIEKCHAIQNENHEILEDEAVCRICLLELREGESLKMACSCRGELALAHKSCAVEWFSIKGNKTCDICKRDVQNLPVNQLKVQDAQSTIGLAANALAQVEATNNRVWQDVPVLVLVSMLAYFCLLEQLSGSKSLNPVNDVSKHTIEVDLPLSCVLGLLSAMLAFIIGSAHIWVYAYIQFFIVILCAYFIYSLIGVSPIPSVLFSSFIGFALAFCTKSVMHVYHSSRQSPHNNQYNGRDEQNQQNTVISESQNGNGDQQLQVENQNGE